MNPVYTPSFDGIPLDIISHETDLSPRVAQHLPTRGRGAQLDYRGRGPRADRVTVKTTGADQEQLDYRGWLQGLASSGAARRFVHPFDGSWLARISGLSERSAAGSFEFSFAFVEDVPHTVRADGNRGAVATLQELSVAAEALDAAAEPVTLDAAIPSGSDTVSAVKAWDPHDIDAAMDSYRRGQRAAQSQLRTDDSRAAYEASRALSSFSGLLEQYALATVTNNRQYHRFTVLRTQPLIVQLTQLYGALDGRRIAAEVASINMLSDILMVRAGTRLQLPRL